MKLWLDAQISPVLAGWLEENFELEEVRAIQSAGNTSNRAMKRILLSALPAALELIRSGEPLVEISDIE